jgi:hypothetical protein
VQATPLSITATGAQLSYQWYSNTSPENSGGLLLTDNTNPSIIPPTSAVDTLYYYCIVKGYCIDDSVTSAVSGPVIVKPLPAASLSGITTVCQNSASPPVTFIGSNGTSPYTFFYNINGGLEQGATSGSGNDTAFVYLHTI